jgi:(4S)-4-hydroxy-5-phosphonooxypentane-2,3-dione isomerase
MSSDALHVVTVHFRLHPKFVPEFRQAMIANAEESLREEPGCRAFEVCEDATGREVFLYELYESPAAFALHLASEHFQTFDALTADWVMEKNVSTYGTLLSAVTAT